MLNGSTLLRVLLVVASAAVLTTLVQRYWSSDAGTPATPVVVMHSTMPTKVAEQAPVKEPTKGPAKPQPTEATPSVAAAVPTPPAPASPATPPRDTTPARPELSLFSQPEPPQAFPQVSSYAESTGRGAVAERSPPSQVSRNAAIDPQAELAANAQDDAMPDTADEASAALPGAATDALDLNTASLSQLNGLKGGGAIGRAIIQHRPYASVNQLLSKRVLSRSTFQRIKDQVTVR